VAEAAAGDRNGGGGVTRITPEEAAADPVETLHEATPTPDDAPTPNGCAGLS